LGFSHYASNTVALSVSVGLSAL